MVHQISKKLWGALAVLLLTFNILLAACSSLQASPTATPIGAVSLPSVQINTGTGTTIINPTNNVTSTPVIVATSELTNPASVGTTPANTPATVATTVETTTATSALDTTITPTIAPSPTPTLEGAPVKVDKTYELKLIKTAYDALLVHLFKQPDTTKLLNAALTDLAGITNQPVPTTNFGQDANDNWNMFVTAFNKTVDNATSSGFSYPKGQLAHREVTSIANAVNDEHTSFLSKDEFKQRNNLLQGDNTSIGFGIVFTTTDTNELFIVRVIPGSGADKAGLKAGDQIVKYDDEVATTKTKTTIRAANQDTTHTFTIKRPNEPQLLTIKATKGAYTMPTVEYRLINNHIGYIAIRDFFTNVANETDKAMTDLYKQGARAWIVDVRDNPGGVNAEEVVGRFVKGGQVMGYDINRKDRLEDKVSNEGVNGPDNGKPYTPLLPLVLLVDQGSASSSEILALAVRDFNLGPIIGEKTSGALGHTAAFGLGDDTAITITVDEYVSVKEEKANGVGVVPDIKVSITPEDYANNRDPQLVAGVSEIEKTLAKTNTGS